MDVLILILKVYISECRTPDGMRVKCFFHKVCFSVDWAPYSMVVPASASMPVASSQPSSPGSPLEGLCSSRAVDQPHRAGLLRAWHAVPRVPIGRAPRSEAPSDEAPRGENARGVAGSELALVPWEIFRTFVKFPARNLLEGLLPLGMLALVHVSRCLTRNAAQTRPVITGHGEGLEVDVLPGVTERRREIMRAVWMARRNLQAHRSASAAAENGQGGVA